MASEVRGHLCCSPASPSPAEPAGSCRSRRPWAGAAGAGRRWTGSWCRSEPGLSAGATGPSRRCRDPPARSCSRIRHDTSFDFISSYVSHLKALTSKFLLNDWMIQWERWSVRTVQTCPSPAAAAESRVASRTRRRRWRAGPCGTERSPAERCAAPQSISPETAGRETPETLYLPERERVSVHAAVMNTFWNSSEANVLLSYSSASIWSL